MTCAGCDEEIPVGRPYYTWLAGGPYCETCALSRAYYGPPSGDGLVEFSAGTRRARWWWEGILNRRVRTAIVMITCCAAGYAFAEGRVAQSFALVAVAFVLEALAEVDKE